MYTCSWFICSKFHADRTLRAVDLEQVLALRTDHRAARLERAAGAAREDAHRADVVLVGDLAGRIARAARGRSGCRRRSGTGRCLMKISPVPTTRVIGPAASPIRKWARSTEWLRMSVDTPWPAWSTRNRHDSRPSGSDAVHREEPPVVVRDVADRAAVDELLGVLHERRPAVVVADPGDHAGPPGRPLGGDGLRRRAADGLLAEHVLAVGRRGLDHLDVEHVRSGHEHDVDVAVLDHARASRRRAVANPNDRTASSRRSSTVSLTTTSSGS